MALPGQSMVRQSQFQRDRVVWFEGTMSGHWYTAYGLNICSEVPLPVPASEPSDADVVVRMGAVDAAPPFIGESRSLVRATKDEICSLLGSVVKVSVRSGREITVDPMHCADTQTIAPWIQGASLSLVLHQRGFLVMHASAVEIDGKAVAFIGECGWGKSTTAAAMHARGHRLLADDIVAIRLDADGRPVAVSGFPHLKITDEAVRFMGEDPTALNQVIDDPQKLLRISKSPPEQPLPLAAIFVLGEGEACGIEPLGANRALPELMRHGFVARYSEFLKLTDTAAIHFKTCTEVIRHASICQLRRPKSFELLGHVAELVEQHVRGQSSRTEGN